MEDSIFKSPVRTFWYAIRPFRLAVFTLMLLIVIGNILTYSTPYFLKEIVDIATYGTTPSFQDFLRPLTYIALLLIGAEACYRIGHLIEVHIAPRMFERITSSLFEWLIRRPTAYFEEHLSGELGRRVDQVAMNLQFFIEYFPWEVGWPIMSAVVTAVLLYSANSLLALCFVVWLLVSVVLSYVLLKWQYRTAEEVATAQAHLSGMTVDSLANVSIVHTFGAYQHEQNLYASHLSAAVAADKRARFASLVNKAQQGVSVAVLGIGLPCISVLLFSRHAITVGDFVLVAATIPTVSGVVWTLGDLLVRAMRNYGEMHSALKGLRDTAQGILEKKHGLTVHDACVTFSNVSFAYPESGYALAHVDLAIPSGQKVGLVGRSGAGKSTFVKLLLRQYDPLEGTIHIGDTDISRVSLESLRAHITFVPQDTSLFQRTLYENILYAKPNASSEEVHEAARRAHAEEFILQYPAGYETKVGERGVKLSGGQRQRIALARAMLKNAPILVLDEATSALDSESEEIVQKGLAELFEAKTVIAIAHRLSTLSAMDRIIVLDAGQVIEDGSPQELLNKPGSVFKEMWEHQKSGFIS
ncbi:MAG: ABC transporter ATP-binding protein [Bacillota bacterium]